MHTELGHYVLMQTLFFVLFFKHKDIFWLISMAFLTVTTGLCSTLIGYMCSDLSIFNIFTNSNVNTPLFYKISATWSNHEGSFLLWCWLLGLYGFLFCYCAEQSTVPWTRHRETDHFASLFRPRRSSPPDLSKHLLAVPPLDPVLALDPLRRCHSQGSMSFGKRGTVSSNTLDRIGVQLKNSLTRFDVDWGFARVMQTIKWRAGQQGFHPFLVYGCIVFFFVAFLILTSNPFLKMPFMCLNSIVELNPVLQDPVLAIHPPCIYAGYVASAVGFSICFSKLMQPQSVDLSTLARFLCRQTPRKKIAKEVQTRTWTLIAWCFLTVGILLGSWWAYHELGWGGWWFWDPVENASLMPWICATAAIHSVIVPRLSFVTLCLNVSIFVLSLLGTFFVRSGLLASVHSFAEDSTRGLFLLSFLLCVTITSVFFLLKQGLSTPAMIPSKTQMEQILRLQALFWGIICAVVLCGTSAPIVFQLCFNRDVSTGAPFFNGTLVPLFASILVMLVYVHYTQLEPSTHKLHDDDRGVKHEGPLWSSLWKGKLSATLTYLGLLCLFHLIAFLSFSDFSFLETSYIMASMSLFCCLMLAPRSKRFKVRQVTPTRSISTLFPPLHPNALECTVQSAKHQGQGRSDEAAAAWLSNTVQPLPSRFIAFTIYLKKISFHVKLAHAGVGLFLMGVLLSNAHKIQLTQMLHSGSQVRLGSQIFCFRGIDQNYGPTFHSVCGNLVVYEHGRSHQLSGLLPTRSVPPLGPPLYGDPTGCGFPHAVGPSPLWVPYGHKGEGARQKQASWITLLEGANERHNAIDGAFAPSLTTLNRVLCLFPEKRFFFFNPQLSTTKVAIHTNLFTDFYCLIGAGSLETGWYTTIMRLPFIGCIWIGFLLASIGGLYSLGQQQRKQRVKWT